MRSSRSTSPGDCWGDPGGVNSCAKMMQLCMGLASPCSCPPELYLPGEVPVQSCSEKGIGMFDVPTLRRPMECEKKTSRTCKRQKALGRRLLGLLVSSLGPGGVLLLIGDSTLRKMFDLFCHCAHERGCSFPGVKAGALKRLQVCTLGTLSAADSAALPIVLFDEIAGGPLHLAYKNKVNRAEATLERVNRTVDLPKRGKLVVVSNFGALHTLHIHSVGGWKPLPDNVLTGATDFEAFVKAREILEHDHAVWRAAGAAGFIVSTPNWVCKSRLPGSILKWHQPEAGPEAQKLNDFAVGACVDDVARHPEVPEWAAGGGKSRDDRIKLCRSADIGGGGAETVRDLQRETVAALRSAGATDIAVSDGHAITKAAGCGNTHDGRHYGEPVMVSQWEELFGTIARLGAAGVG